MSPRFFVSLLETKPKIKIKNVVAVAIQLSPSDLSDLALGQPEAKTESGNFLN